MAPFGLTLSGFLLWQGVGLHSPFSLPLSEDQLID